MASDVDAALQDIEVSIGAQSRLDIYLHFFSISYFYYFSGSLANPDVNSD
jgi:hypothetical protein